MSLLKVEPNFRYARSIKPKHAAIAEVHLRDLAPRIQKTSPRWRAVGDTVYNLTGLGIELTPSIHTAM